MSPTPITFNLLKQKANIIITKRENGTSNISNDNDRQESLRLPSLEKRDLPEELSLSNPNLNGGSGGSTTTTEIRSEILHLSFRVGNLCNQFLMHAPLDGNKESILFWKTDSSEKKEISLLMGTILLSLLVISQLCQLDLCTCIMKKIQLNAKKYPAKLCKGKAGKYTMYSKETGITKTSGQSTLNPEFSISTDLMNKYGTSIQDTTSYIRQFASERNWERHHSPRNIVLALMGELGELAELFQWNGDPIRSDEDVSIISDEDRDHIGQELADVCIYLIRLADVCHIDLGQAALEA